MGMNPGMNHDMREMGVARKIAGMKRRDPQHVVFDQETKRMEDAKEADLQYIS